MFLVTVSDCRRPLAVVMVESGAMSWLLRTLPEDRQAPASEGRTASPMGVYGFEYATALFMNLCLSPRGRQECARQPGLTMDVIVNLYERNLPGTRFDSGGGGSS